MPLETEEIQGNGNIYVKGICFFLGFFLFCLFFVNSQEVFKEKRKQRKSVKFKATIFVSLHPLK